MVLSAMMKMIGGVIIVAPYIGLWYLSAQNDNLQTDNDTLQKAYNELMVSTRSLEQSIKTTNATIKNYADTVKGLTQNAKQERIKMKEVIKSDPTTTDWSNIAIPDAVRMRLQQ